MTVSELTEHLKAKLEQNFASVDVEGEVSNYHYAKSGHHYFTLKDDGATLQAVLFRGAAGAVNFQLQDGLLLRVRGGVTVYAKRGNYQLVCTSLVRLRDGDILARLEARKRALAQEGLFAEERKREIPRFIQRVGVITSPRGAAVRDFLHVVRRRNAMIDIIVLPTAVQGDAAGAEVCARIEYANRHGLADVLVVTRGGGALEDLLPFSEERVVRAVAGSGIPVVSAIGHEIDVALCELASDMRASTPSAAAELIAEDSEKVLVQMQGMRGQLCDSISEKLRYSQALLEHVSLDKLAAYQERVVQERAVALDDCWQKLVDSQRRGLELQRGRVAGLGGELRALSPRSILERGYAIVFKDTAAGAPGEKRDGGGTRKHISSSREVSENDILSIELHDSRIVARVSGSE